MKSIVMTKTMTVALTSVTTDSDILAILLSSTQRHPDGVASVKFKDVESADKCVESLSGR